MAAANTDAKGGPRPPTSLRVSTDENRECDTCSYFQHGHCTLPQLKPISLSVDGEWVCDEWEKNASGRESRARNLEEASGEALKRIRADRASEDSGK